MNEPKNTQNIGNEEFGSEGKHLIAIHPTRIHPINNNFESIQKSDDIKAQVIKKLIQQYLLFQVEIINRKDKLRVLEFKKNYQLLDRQELRLLGISGCRLNLAMLLRSKLFDISMKCLMIFYTLLIFAYLAIEDIVFDEKNKIIFYQIEIALLIIFLIEILLIIFSYAKLYLQDIWNVFDMIIIIVCAVFACLEVFSNNAKIKSALKIQGIFRLLRILVLVRRINTLRVKQDISKKKTIQGYDLVSPYERVIKILNDIRDRTSNSEQKIIEDLNYCIKMIQSQQLYEVKIDLDENEAKGEVIQLYNQYSTQNQQRRSSKRLSNSSNHSVKSDLLKETYLDNILPKTVEEVLKLNQQAQKELQKIESIDFNVFLMQTLTNNNELVTVTSYILAKHNILKKTLIDFEIFMNFMKTIQGGYKDVTYHNKTHAADLCQTFYYFLTTCQLQQKTQIDNLELLSLIIAGACHDFEHPGLNNVYLVETQHELAIRYNDQSVLENHHIASSFAVMNNQSCNIFEKFSKEDYKKCRKLMVESVLLTDMAKHFGELGKFKSRISANDYDPSQNEKDKELTLFMMFHLADISNSTKQWDKCQKWTELLFVEFFNQGDLERQRGQPISYLMDRTIVQIAKSQIGFYDFIIKPSFEAVREVLPLIQVNIDNVNNNKENWSSRFEEYEMRMEDEKEKLLKLKGFES